MKPKPKHNELLERLMLIAKDGKRLSRFETASIEKEARILIERNISVSAGREILATCASLQGSVDGVYDAWEKGRLAYDRDEYSILRYAIAFADVGEERKARELAMQGVDDSPKDPKIVKVAADLLGRCGFLIESAVMYSRLNFLTGSNGAEPLALQLANRMTSEQVSEPIIFARHFARSSGTDPTGLISWVSRDEAGNPIAVCQVLLALSTEETSDLEFELHKALEDQQFPAESDGRVVIGLVSSPPREARVIV